ncbi:hypothetical protein [Aeromicrobium piscarium]|uniref:Alpha/beta hydrolase n=1 Tax=Aeromicrobium piscarium TaxID=2590901 RepID=A0A554RWF9_9ACTN|nr:hypothetical protein [Aeromicrobium piscarium]TSD58405.1 hypothetical protein FNM00_14495 [Aeromicrobium piscarium]
MVHVDIDSRQGEGPAVVILPGVGYTAQAPLLYWSARALADDGWCVATVSWTVDDAARARSREFVEDAYRRACSVLDRTPGLVVGKSFGSWALPIAVDAGVPGVWLTPLLMEDAISDALRSAGADHLAIGGTEDPAWLPERVEGTRARLVTIEDADHGIEVSSWDTSMEIQRGIVASVADHARHRVHRE